MIEYYIPTEAGDAEYVEKRSRFLGKVRHVESEEEARAFIDSMKKQYYDARHNCWCYRIREGGIIRYSDDGEPQGTAGQPMLNVFEKEEITDVVCVVTRYFGGVLLGAGGLVRAYTKAAKDALDAAGVSVVRRWVQMIVGCDYKIYERVKQESERFGAVIKETEFSADVMLTVLVPEEKTEGYCALIIDLTAGSVEPMEDGETFSPVPLQRGEGCE